MGGASYRHHPLQLLIYINQEDWDWRPHILRPECSHVYTQPFLGPLGRVGGSTILLEYIIPLRVICLDPWLDFALQNFQIAVCVDSYAWWDEHWRHFLPIRRYQTKNHDWSWVFGAVSTLNMVSNISRIIYPSIISGVRNGIDGKYLFIWKQAGSSTYRILDIIRHRLATVEPGFLLCLGQQWDFHPGPGLHLEIICDQSLHCGTADVEVSCHLPNGPRRIVLGALRRCLTFLMRSFVLADLGRPDPGFPESVPVLFSLVLIL